ncbi:heme oxygenase (biliverdin-producing) [Agromyces archimandritae]|uniref:Biliverdin-producing heme oxygenase n=1 Tax=Agromyces archimandritae TaxID=2781962 RepID=A0A975IN74_9MICO|nr:biliverdin-producing heme oxygenase [Agromyces archimandritae]QTX04313.1 biliverdin-producing heme oxygenase [Agromyces archimandritae]
MSITVEAPARSAEAPLDVAALVRAASADVHKDAENRGFIVDLMGGKLSLAEYTRYLAQYAWIYEALEARGSRSGDPKVFDPGLARLAAIEADLVALGAADWRDAHPMLPATRDYVEHLRELAGDDVRYLAHHYTRYLGDLSGGQAIAKLVARHYGATEEQLSFYRFDIAADGVVKVKRAYREAMNDLALDPEQVDRLVAEVLESFRYNAAVFEALAA